MPLVTCCGQPCEVHRSGRRSWWPRPPRDDPETDAAERFHGSGSTLRQVKGKHIKVKVKVKGKHIKVKVKVKHIKVKDKTRRGQGQTHQGQGQVYLYSTLKATSADQPQTKTNKCLWT